MWWIGASEPRRRQTRTSRDDRPESVLRFSARERSRGSNWSHRLVVAAIVLSSLTAGVILSWVVTRSLGRLLFSQNDLFLVRNIKIECKGNSITPRHIMEYTRLSEIKHLFAVNIQDIRTQLLLKVPRLKEVEITRRLPAELDICVWERTAIAQLELNHYYLALDREGYVLGKVTESKTLPVLSGCELAGVRPGVQLTASGMRRALEIIDVCQTTPVGQQVRIKSMNVKNPQALELELDGGEHVVFAWHYMEESSSRSRRHLEQKLGRLAENLKSAARRNKRIAKIDMTLENNFPALEY